MSHPYQPPKAPSGDSPYWRRITPSNMPPIDVLVWTKIHDDLGPRNVARLRWGGKCLWFCEDGTYVYYTPTHFWSL